MEKILEPMFESMDIEQEQKVKLQESFDNAVLKKTTQMLDEHVDAKVAEKVEILEEEYTEKVTLLEDSLDGYLDSVVEEFIAENTPMYEAQIDDEKAKTLLEMFDQMVRVVGVDMLTITEAKEDRDEEAFNESAEAQVDVLTDKVADMADRLVESKREADKYLQAGVINETAEGLTILEKVKFEKLAEMVTFDRSAGYLEKLEIIKESIVDSRVDGFEEDKDTRLPGTAFKQPEKVDVAAATDFSRYV